MFELVLGLPLLSRYMAIRVSLCPVPVAELCGPGVTCFPVGLPSGVGGQVYFVLVVPALWPRVL